MSPDKTRPHPGSIEPPVQSVLSDFRALRRPTGNLSSSVGALSRRSAGLRRVGAFVLGQDLEFRTRWLRGAIESFGQNKTKNNQIQGYRSGIRPHVRGVAKFSLEIPLFFNAANLHMSRTHPKPAVTLIVCTLANQNPSCFSQAFSPRTNGSSRCLISTDNGVTRISSAQLVAHCTSAPTRAKEETTGDNDGRQQDNIHQP
ncbi:hypothetical protein FALCPG4_19028 [Fusarium falciforme]